MYYKDEDINMKETIDMHSFTDITILVISGGKGTRLSSLLEEIPKPMIQIGNTPCWNDYYFMPYDMDFINSCLKQDIYQKKSRSILKMEKDLIVKLSISKKQNC